MKPNFKYYANLNCTDNFIDLLLTKNRRKSRTLNLITSFNIFGIRTKNLFLLMKLRTCMFHVCSSSHNAFLKVIEGHSRNTIPTVHY